MRRRDLATVAALSTLLWAPALAVFIGHDGPFTHRAGWALITLALTVVVGAVSLAAAAELLNTVGRAIDDECAAGRTGKPDGGNNP